MTRLPTRAAEIERAWIPSVFLENNGSGVSGQEHCCQISGKHQSHFHSRDVGAVGQRVQQKGREEGQNLEAVIHRAGATAITCFLGESLTFSSWEISPMTTRLHFISGNLRTQHHFLNGSKSLKLCGGCLLRGRHHSFLVYHSPFQPLYAPMIFMIDRAGVFQGDSRAQLSGFSAVEWSQQKLKT